MKLAGGCAACGWPCREPRPSSGRHPALFVLDGSALFPLLSACCVCKEARPATCVPACPMIVALGETSEALYDQRQARARFQPKARRRGRAPAAGGPVNCSGPLTDRWPVDRRWLSLMGHSFQRQFALHAA